MVEGYFHIGHSALLNSEQKTLLIQKLANKINSEGFLQVRSQVHRSQLDNKREVIKKMHQFIENGLKKNKKRIPTKPSSSSREKRIEQKKKNMDGEIVAALGPDLGKQYQRDQDYSYRQLASLAAHNDLPADTADKIYDDKEAAEQAVKQVRTDTSLTPQERQAALQQIRTETENTVKKALGDKSYRRYLQSGGWWINNLAPMPFPRHS